MNEPDDAVNPDKKALAMRLKGLREGLSWTLGELSQATKHMDPMNEGISKVSISRYENGDSYPGYREIKLLAQALGVSITFLFYGDVPDPYAGWEFSLDEYLRSVIKDVLIEEGLVNGESRAQRDAKKMRALSILQHRRGPLSVNALDDEDKAQVENREQTKWDELKKLAHEADALTSRKGKKNQK